MKHLLTINESDIITENKDLDHKDFRQRDAARAVVLDENNKVALLKANAHNYHKLPGGGVEAGEDMQLALKRELLEEIGCQAKIISEIGEVIEYRDKWQLRQTSHCYLACKVGNQIPPEFTQSEIDEGFEIVWADNVDMAIALLEQEQPQNYDGLFIKRRDLTILRAAKCLL